MNKLIKIKQLNKLQTNTKNRQKKMMDYLTEYRTNFLFRSFIISTILFCPLFFIIYPNVILLLFVGVMVNLLFASVSSIFALYFFGKEKKIERIINALSKKEKKIKDEIDYILETINENDLIEGSLILKSFDKSLAVDVLDAYEINKGLVNIEDAVFKSIDKYIQNKMLTTTTEETLRLLKYQISKDLQKAKENAYQERIENIKIKNNKLINE